MLITWDVLGQANHGLVSDKSSFFVCIVFKLIFFSLQHEMYNAFLRILPKPFTIALLSLYYTSSIYIDPANARKSLFRNNQEPMKIFLSSMYEIPVFSAVIWMLPLAGKKGTDWQFNATVNPYSTSAWHADAW